MKRAALSKSIHLLPSLFTTVALFFAFFSIIRSINGDYERAAWAILIASFFDLADGRIARMTKTMSEFGREYDSLVDLSSFGLAPAILIYTWSLSTFKPLGWFFCFLFFACAALRLARFNVQTVATEKKRFTGLPTPAAACLLATLVLFYEEASSWSFFNTLSGMQAPVLILVPSLALLMVSTTSYRSFKEYEGKKIRSVHILIAVAALLGLIAINPPVMLFIGFLMYVLLGPTEYLVSLSRRKRTTRVKTAPKKFSVIPFQQSSEKKESHHG